MLFVIFMFLPFQHLQVHSAKNFLQFRYFFFSVLHCGKLSDYSKAINYANI